MPTVEPDLQLLPVCALFVGRREETPVVELQDGEEADEAGAPAAAVEQVGRTVPDRVVTGAVHPGAVVVVAEHRQGGAPVLPPLRKYSSASARADFLADPCTSSLPGRGPAGPDRTTGAARTVRDRSAMSVTEPGAAAHTFVEMSDGYDL
ncbi:hypothetical protein [Streptomyces sp. NPDC057939]|uniref:hypothetical protein n=1 Tax=Streptomyces sp. NPDC057939 TaxID=3346284 RepID=UPI0036ED2DCB